jgi:hypothetical protein
VFSPSDVGSPGCVPTRACKFQLRVGVEYTTSVRAPLEEEELRLVAMMIPAITMLYKEKSRTMFPSRRWKPAVTAGHHAERGCRWGRIHHGGGDRGLPGRGRDALHVANGVDQPNGAAEDVAGIVGMGGVNVTMGVSASAGRRGGAIRVRGREMMRGGGKKIRVQDVGR